MKVNITYRHAIPLFTRFLLAVLKKKEKIRFLDKEILLHRMICISDDILCNISISRLHLPRKLAFLFSFFSKHSQNYLEMFRDSCY